MMYQVLSSTYFPLEFYSSVTNQKPRGYEKLFQKSDCIRHDCFFETHDLRLQELTNI